MKVAENIKKFGIKELSNLVFTSPRTRHLLLPVAERKIKKVFMKNAEEPYELPSELEGQYYFVRDLLRTGCERMDENLLSPDVMKTTFQSFVDNVLFKAVEVKERVYAENKLEYPTLVVICPTHRCNLQCTGVMPAAPKKLPHTLTGTPSTES